MEVRFTYLDRQWESERLQVYPEIERVLRSGQWIAGEEVEALERELAAFCGVRFCVSVNSGTDALILSLIANGVGPGSKVVTAANSYVATGTAPLWVGAEVTFVDSGEDLNISLDALDKLAPDSFDAIIPVHLTGRMAQMREILEWSARGGCKVIEDAAQAIGASIENQKAGSWGDCGAFSLHPLKNLNAAGDGGFVTTDDEKIAEEIRLMRQNGHLTRDKIGKIGKISRLDPLQAAIVRSRLQRLPEVTQRRRQIADFYSDTLGEYPIRLPLESKDSFSVFHTYVLQTDRRDAVRAYLSDAGIETKVHYPILISEQEPVRLALRGRASETPESINQKERILSLPIHQCMRDEEVEYVARTMSHALETLMD